MPDFTKQQKKEIAEKAIKMQAADIVQMDIAKFFNIPRTTLKHWLKDFKDGKFDNLEPKNNSKTLNQIDTRPALKKISDSIDNLASGLEQTCIRLDSIYAKLSEYSDISKEIFEEMNKS
jgi:methyl-accepting chemotaxis protein